MMGITDWSKYRETLSITEEDATHIRLEGELIDALVVAREKAGMTQRQLAEASGLKQSVVARLEKAVHSPQIGTLIRVLEPLGYTLSIVPKDSHPQSPKDSHPQSQCDETNRLL